MAKRFVAGSIKLEGLDEVIAELRKRGMDAAAGVEEICHAGATAVREEIESRAPGRFAENMVQVTTSKDGANRVTVTVGIRKDSYIARFLEFGVQPHSIPRAGKVPAPGVKPKRRKRLRVLRFNGRYARRVNHPGFAPRPFMRPGYEASKDDAQDAMSDKTKKIIRA